MPATRYSNLFPHERHGLKELFRWKLADALRVPPRRGAQAESATPRPAWRSGSERITWIGHSSFLLDALGKRILVDPVFSNYCAPLHLPRFRRRSRPGICLAEAGQIDAVFITHNHYDHLDRATILQLPQETLYLVPEGLGVWFNRLDRKNIREFAWWQTAEVLGYTVSAVPAQHFSSRTFWDRDRTLWCGWVLQNAEMITYFAGDTGYCPVFREIGERFGPIDLAAIPIGAYEPRWFMRPMHVNPEEAVQIHQDIRARRSIACHWGTFRLTDEPMDEPPGRLRTALRAAGVPENDFLVLNVGESVALR